MKTRVFCFIILLFSTGGNEILSQWNQIPDLAYVPVTCMVTVGDSTILVGGQMGTLLRSIDNGATWTSVWGNGISIDTILSLGAGNGYIFASADRVNSLFRSSDDGITWNQPGLLDPRVWGFAYVDTILYAATDWGVYHSANHGESWLIDTLGLGYDPAIPAGYSNGTISIAYLSSRLYVIKYFAKGIYVSATDTIRWKRIGLNTWEGSLAAVDTNIFALAGGVYMYSGSDTTWLSRNNGLPQNAEPVILRSVDSLLFVYTAYDGIYVSGDLGLHWESMQSPSTSPIETMATTKTHMVVEGGMSAWRLAANDVVLSVGHENPRLPFRFGLEQNFPNPFNPTTVISYQLSAISNVRLSVYDVLGREIEKLVNAKLGPGNHTAKWDAQGHPSGVYLLRLLTDQNSEALKMLLVR